ncbi:MAG: hypothetical protein VX549_07235 [Pseudomonadota bacterium]|nr:hypothetical protein [Pseudomonadota bacterium]
MNTGWIPAGISALTLLLAGCSGSSDGSGNCNAITGGATQVDAPGSCTGCTATNPHLAIDGNTVSAATLVIETAGSGTMHLRAIAQDGVVYAAGTRLSVFAESVFDGEATSHTVELRTYLDGVATGDSRQLTGINGVRGGGLDRDQYFLETTSAFDAAELAHTQSTSTGDITYQIYEFCTGD